MMGCGSAVRGMWWGMWCLGASVAGWLGGSVAGRLGAWVARWLGGWVPGWPLGPSLGGRTDLGGLGWFAGQWGRFFLSGRFAS